MYKKEVVIAIFMFYLLMLFLSMAGISIYNLYLFVTKYCFVIYLNVVCNACFYWIRRITNKK